jgi:hypothetical protein
VLRTNERLPEEHLDLAAARERVRAEAWPDWQKQQFLLWADELASHHHVTVDRDRLRE